jgi:hypothetical protein
MTERICKPRSESTRAIAGEFPEEVCNLPPTNAPGKVTRPPCDRIGFRLCQIEKMNMNKQELIDAVASAVGTSKSAAGEAVDAFVAGCDASSR